VEDQLKVNIDIMPI